MPMNEKEAAHGDGSPSPSRRALLCREAATRWLSEWVAAQPGIAVHPGMEPTELRARIVGVIGVLDIPQGPRMEFVVRSIETVFGLVDWDRVIDDLGDRPGRGLMDLSLCYGFPLRVAADGHGSGRVFIYPQEGAGPAASPVVLRADQAVQLALELIRESCEARKACDRAGAEAVASEIGASVARVVEGWARD
jgi:hypothetical protein